MSHYIIAPSPEKSLCLFRPTIIYRQKSSPPGGRAGRIFIGKLSTGGDFSGGRSYNVKTFYEAGDILIRGLISNP